MSININGSIQRALEELRNEDALPPGSEKSFENFLWHHFNSCELFHQNGLSDETHEFFLGAGEAAVKLVMYYPRLARHDFTKDILRQAIRDYIHVRIRDHVFMQKISFDEIFELAIAGDRVGIWQTGPINLESWKAKMLPNSSFPD